jgi:hypothetical protein
VTGRIYSTQFAKGFVDSAAHNLTYTVPAGNVAVLRSIDWVSGAGGNVACLAGGTYFNIILVDASHPATWGHWSGALVLKAGQAFTTIWSGGGTHLVVCGHLYVV